MMQILAWDPGAGRASKSRSSSLNVETQTNITIYILIFSCSFLWDKEREQNLLDHNPNAQLAQGNLSRQHHRGLTSLRNKVVESRTSEATTNKQK